jgi:hypothetical protein
VPQLDEDEREGRQALLPIDHINPPVDYIGYVGVQVVPRVVGRDRLFARIQVAGTDVLLLELVKDVIQEAKHGFIRPPIIALVKVDIVSGIRKDAVNILLIGRNV